MIDLNVRIDNRNFTTLPIKPFKMEVNKLAFTAYGGPDSALVTAHAPFDRLLDFVSLLRCPLTVSDPAGDPVWWGYINKIEITFNHVKFFISLEDLFNKVKVLYSYLSPSNIKAELYDTGFKGSPLSQAEYGIKERVLLREGIDDEFALALRNTFLEVSAFPRTQLKPLADVEVATIKLHGLGWMHSLGWRFYENTEGFYANHGPGPGQQAIGDGTTSVAVQWFYVAQSFDLHHAYFMLRKQGAPTGDITARLYSNSGSAPSAGLAMGSSYAGTALDANKFSWFKFTWATPYTLAASTSYWIGLRTTVSSSTDHFVLKTDEDLNFTQKRYARRYTTIWVTLVPIVNTGVLPQLYFRVICSVDSGSMLKTLAAATGEFITGIQTISSGVLTTPYRTNGLTTLQEIRKLMQLGTVNQRKILANVDINRRLTFYEQPNPTLPTATLDPSGRFHTRDRSPLPPYRPPIGQFAMLTGVDRFAAPFDLKRTPAYFVDSYVYRPWLSG